MNRQTPCIHRRRHLPALAALATAAAACQPALPTDAGIGITCGSLGLTAPSVEITLDRTSALTAGKLAVEPLPVTTMTFDGAVVEVTTPSSRVRCEARGGKFRVVIRGDSAVDGTLRIAATRPVPIVVRTAAGVERAAQAFDPANSAWTALTWDVGSP